MAFILQNLRPSSSIENMEDITQKRPYAVNANFETTFDITEGKPILKIHNRERVNRPLATQDEIGHTSFGANLQRVHYGTYEDKPVCLVSLDFSFRFKAKTLCRYNYAEVEVEFEKAIDPKNPELRNTSPLLDPKVVNLAPKEVYGVIKLVNELKHWEVSIPAMFQSSVGISAGITASVGAKTYATAENRMEIHGNLSQDDDHDEGANGATWDLTENQAHRDGIFRHFRAVILIQHQPQEAFWMRVTVKPSVKFSLDPRRLSQKGDVFHKLLQLNDDPILLDGKTPHGPADCGSNNFSSKDFPWEKVLQFPKEYENQLMLQSSSSEDTPSSSNS
ncbi:hypothetical protein GP486_005046 [Trichoglossum hirsutum]|uniref:Uncharacterized protein n=1 Tax=Trichoglossum hirsutum TaxID=265104 RepID=A0A9P8L9X0_9PEZI|nr:hypothetical protein GP486_005046 [Trichoglossum hirsutum]